MLRLKLIFVKVVFLFKVGVKVFKWLVFCNVNEYRFYWWDLIMFLYILISFFLVFVDGLYFWISFLLMLRKWIVLFGLLIVWFGLIYL